MRIRRERSPSSTRTFPEEMLADKLASIRQSGAETVTACDMGCLMHIGGAVSRQNLPVSVQHVAQILDGGEG